MIKNTISIQHKHWKELKTNTEGNFNEKLIQNIKNKINSLSITKSNKEDRVNILKKFDCNKKVMVYYIH